MGTWEGEKELEDIFSEQAIRTMAGDLERLKKAASKKAAKPRPARQVKTEPKSIKPAQLKSEPKKQVGPIEPALRPRTIELLGNGLTILSVALILGVAFYLWYVSNLTQFVLDEIRPVQRLVINSFDQIVGADGTSQPKPTPPAGEPAPAPVFPVDRSIIVNLAAGADFASFLANLEQIQANSQLQPEEFVQVAFLRGQQELSLADLLRFIGFRGKLGAESEANFLRFLSNQYTFFWYVDSFGKIYPGLAAKLKPASQVDNFPRVIPAFRQAEAEIAASFERAFLAPSIEAPEQNDDYQFETVIANTTLLHRRQVGSAFNQTLQLVLQFPDGWFVVTSSEASLSRLLNRLP